MTVEEIKSKIKELSNLEIVDLRDWLESVADDAENRLEVTDEFKAKIKEAMRNR